MLDFHKEHTVSQKNRQGILPTFIWASLVNIYIIGAWCIYGYYSQHDMSAFPIVYLTTTWLEFPTFLLALLGLYFRW